MLSHSEQQLSGRVDDADWRLAGGLARNDAGRWTIGLYPESVSEDFAPTRSYVELQVPGPGRYRVDDPEGVDEQDGVDKAGSVDARSWSARFLLCPADTPRRQCIGTNTTRRVVAATAGSVLIVQSQDGGALTVSGSAQLEGGLGNQVDGTFPALVLYDPVCQRTDVRCDGVEVQRCSWDQRSWTGVATCDSADTCDLELQCSITPSACDAGSRCAASP